MTTNKCLARNKSHKCIKSHNKNKIILNNTIILHFVQTVNETLETHLKDNGARRCCGPGKENIHVCDTSRKRKACIGSCVQKDKMIPSTQPRTQALYLHPALRERPWLRLVT